MSDTTTVDDVDTPTTDTPPPADDKPLGDAGEKALAAWKERAKKAEADAKRAKTLEAELAQLREQQMTDTERIIEAARKDAAEAARAEVLAESNRRLLAAELKAATTGVVADPDLLSDPDVALRLLGFDDIPTTESGDIDAEAISAAVGSLVEAKPYLKASATRPPDLEQGARRRTEQVDPAALTDPDEVIKWGLSNRKRRF